MIPMEMATKFNAVDLVSKITSPSSSKVDFPFSSFTAQSLVLKEIHVPFELRSVIRTWLLASSLHQVIK